MVITLTILFIALALFTLSIFDFWLAVHTSPIREDVLSGTRPDNMIVRLSSTGAKLEELILRPNTNMLDLVLAAEAKGEEDYVKDDNFSISREESGWLKTRLANRWDSAGLSSPSSSAA